MIEVGKLYENPIVGNVYECTEIKDSWVALRRISPTVVNQVASSYHYDHPLITGLRELTIDELQFFARWYASTIFHEERILVQKKDDLKLIQEVIQNGD